MLLGGGKTVKWKIKFKLEGELLVGNRGMDSEKKLEVTTLFRVMRWATIGLSASIPY